MTDWFRRLKYRLDFLMNYQEELNRRVEIEVELFDIAKGVKPLPDKEACRILALKLGTPKSYWTEAMRNI